MTKLVLAAAVAVFASAPAFSLTLPARPGAQPASTVVKPIASNQPGILAPDVVPFAMGELVVNGSFETGDFSGWEQVGDTGFSFVTAELAGGGPTDGEFHAAFGPTDPGGGGIIQSIATTPGGVYSLSFDLANLGGTPNAFGLFWDTQFVFIDLDAPAFDYTNVFGSLVASNSSTTLGFIFYNEPSFWLLDNVSLVSADGVIPEPATWAMMISGFGLVGSALRRRRAAIA